MKRIIPFLLLLCFAIAAHATTYYVRSDGGPSPKCNGTAAATTTATPSAAIDG